MKLLTIQYFKKNILCSVFPPEICRYYKNHIRHQYHSFHSYTSTRWSISNGEFFAKLNRNTWSKNKAKSKCGFAQVNCCVEVWAMAKNLFSAQSEIKASKWKPFIHLLCPNLKLSSLTIRCIKYKGKRYFVSNQKPQNTEKLYFSSFLKTASQDNKWSE